MSENAMGGIALLSFVATVFALAGIWLSDAQVTVKCASTSMLFVLWTLLVWLMARDSR